MATRLPASRSSRDAACEKSSAASRNAKKRRRAVPGVPVDRQVVAMGQCEGPFSKQPGRLPAYRGRHPAPCRQTPPRQGMAPRQRLRAPGIALSRPAPLSWRALQWCKCKLEHLSGLPHCWSITVDTCLACPTVGALQWHACSSCAGAAVAAVVPCLACPTVLACIAVVQQAGTPVWPAPLLVHCSGYLSGLPHCWCIAVAAGTPVWPAHCWCLAVDTCLACPTVRTLQWHACSSC